MTSIPIFIHFGAPKTATSALQEHLFMTAPRVVFRGRPQVDGDIGHFNNAVLHMQSDRQAKEVVVRFYDSLIDEARKTGKDRIIISNEDLLSTHLWKILAERLVVPGYEISLLLTIRSQFTLIESYFASHARVLKYVPDPYNGNPVRFDDWWKFNLDFPNRSIFRILDYAGIVEAISEYRQVPLLVLAYEDLVTRAERYLASIMSITGLDRHEIESRILRQANSRDSERSFIYNNFRQRLFPNVRLSRVPGLEGLVKMADGFLRGGKPIAPMLEKSHRDYIDSKFGSGNRRVAETFGLPLKSLGYPWGQDPA